MEARALKKAIRMSPRKMRLVIDLIRGKKANEAITILRFHPKHAAHEAEMVLRSAIANLNQKADAEGIRIRENDIIIKRATVDQGFTIPRTLPAPRGMVFRIRKRTNHLTIVVGTIDEEVKA
jgi:large subunit ribosomal protein L22